MYTWSWLLTVQRKWPCLFWGIRLNGCFLYRFSLSCHLKGRLYLNTGTRWHINNPYPHANILKQGPRAPECPIYLVSLPGGDHPSALKRNVCQYRLKGTFVRHCPLGWYGGLGAEGPGRQRRYVPSPTPGSGLMDVVRHRPGVPSESADGGLHTGVCLRIARWTNTQPQRGPPTRIITGINHWVWYRGDILEVENNILKPRQLCWWAPKKP